MRLLFVLLLTGCVSTGVSPGDRFQLEPDSCYLMYQSDLVVAIRVDKKVTKDQYIVDLLTTRALIQDSLELFVEKQRAEFSIDANCETFSNTYGYYLEQQQRLHLYNDPSIKIRR